MKILLTGHKGFIGSYMLKALQERGHEVDTFDWDDGNMPSVMEQDWVIHMGAISSTTERDIDKVLRQNYDFSRQLYNACKTYGVNFQYSSSASIYGLISTFREDAPLDPKTPYAWSKYLFERYVTQHPMGSITQGFRYFNVYGPEGEEHKGNQASPYMQFKNQALVDGEIRVFKNSHLYLRDFIHVNKVVEAHLKFMEAKKCGIWNVGTGTTKSFLEVAQDVAADYNVPIREIDMPEILKGSYQEYTCADISKLKSVIADW
jgi:ADP-L-glycero-D-manno-heptose 6-epimerase